MEQFGFAIVMANAREPFILNGAFSDGCMFIISKQYIGFKGKQEIIQVLCELRLDVKKSRGLKVIVSEAAPDISKALGVHHRTIHDRSTSGEPIISISIPVYEEMLNSGAIIVDDESNLNISQFTLPESAYQIDYNLQGDPFYRIDWPNIKDEVKALLLAVYSTTYHAVDSASYLKDVGLILETPKPVNSEVRSIMNTLQSFDEKRDNEGHMSDSGTLTGQIFNGNKNDRVL